MLFAGLCYIPQPTWFASSNSRRNCLLSRAWFGAVVSCGLACCPVLLCVVNTLSQTNWWCPGSQGCTLSLCCWVRHTKRSQWVQRVCHANLSPRALGCFTTHARLSALAVLCQKYRAEQVSCIVCVLVITCSTGSWPSLLVHASCWAGSHGGIQSPSCCRYQCCMPVLLHACSGGNLHKSRAQLQECRVAKSLGFQCMLRVMAFVIGEAAAVQQPGLHRRVMQTLVLHGRRCWVPVNVAHPSHTCRAQ